jgi:hypothetical protein
MNKPVIYEAPKKPKTQNLKRRDIIVYKVNYEETYNEKNEKITKRIETPFNVTKKVNESAKLIKVFTAQEKIKELEKISQVR